MTKYIAFVMFVMYVWMTLYFESICLALAAFAGTFSFFWYSRSLLTIENENVNSAPRLWWVCYYVIPTIFSFLSVFALIGFAINGYLGGLIIAFELGLVIASCLCAVTV